MEVKIERDWKGRIIVFIYPEHGRITLQQGRSGLPINIRFED